MRQFSDLSELLESDSRAMAFYNSLPMSMQRKLYSRGVNTFAQLYECAPKSEPERREPILSAFSANEATGIVPSGGDMTREQWNDSGDLFPISPTQK